MTETEIPRIQHPAITVLGPQSGEPPFRVVLTDGEIAGIAHSLFDVLDIAHRHGMEHVDLDDPGSVRWVGGDKYTWKPHSGVL